MCIAIDAFEGTRWSPERFRQIAWCNGDELDTDFRTVLAHKSRAQTR
jgi:hypothetical protein